MNMDAGWYMEWYHSLASQDDKKLHDQIQEFSEYFSDMLFEEGSSTDAWIRCQAKLENNTWKDEVISRPDELEYFSYTFFKTKVEHMNDCDGYFNSKEQLLCISPKKLDDDITILHEMIHLHEFVLDELPLFYHDVLLWALYSDLRNKINNLDAAISTHAHILNEQDIYSKGGLHDILFLLKSFDLDIQMNYQLGTVFGYDAITTFKDFTYKSKKSDN